jgi:hypothetical protein
MNYPAVMRSETCSLDRGIKPKASQKTVPKGDGIDLALEGHCYT